MVVGFLFTGEDVGAGVPLNPALEVDGPVIFVTGAPVEDVIDVAPPGGLVMEVVVAFAVIEVVLDAAVAFGAKVDEVAAFVPIEDVDGLSSCLIIILVVDDMEDEMDDTEEVDDEMPDVLTEAGIAAKGFLFSSDAVIAAEAALVLLAAGVLTVEEDAVVAVLLAG